MLPFILLLLVLLWSPPLGLAILLALLLAGGLADMDLYQLSVADALDSLSSYESPDEIDADSIACLRETLNRIARGYYMAVYGANLSPTQRRLCRWLAALLFAVAAAIAWSVLVGASEPGQTLLFVAGLIGSALSLIFFWNRRALDKSLGVDNRNTLRWIQANHITKAAGIDGPHEFMQKVRGLYTGHAACSAGYPQQENKRQQGQSSRTGYRAHNARTAHAKLPPEMVARPAMLDGFGLSPCARPCRKFAESQAQ